MLTKLRKPMKTKTKLDNSPARFALKVYGENI